MRKILIVNQSANYLMADIADALFESGVYGEVVLLVGNPNTVSSLVKNRVTIDSFCPYERTTMKSRLMSWTRGFFELIRIIKTKYGDYELLLVSNPPVVAFLPLFIGNKYSTLIYDVYPNGLVDAGFISSNNLIYKIWSARNRLFFGKAQRVFTITDGMANSIASYCSRNKIEVVSLWGNSNIPVLNINKKDNIFLQRNNLLGKFVIMYSGNIGKGHDLDVLVDVADILKENENIVFLFVGEGYLKPIIREKVEKYNLDNVILMPYQDSSILPYSLSCPDLAVVSTNKQSGKVCIPSKTFDIMRLGRPVLCIAEKNSDISNLLRSHNIGKSFTREQVQEIADFILETVNHPEILDEYSNSSREAAKNYTSELAKKYI